MQVQAISKSVRISPRKMRLVADAIRKLSIDDAQRVLKVTPKKAARPLAKTLQSAIANAVNNAKLNRNDLVIETILVNEGIAYKRFRPSTRGRIHPYKKRSSNITIILKEKIVVKPAAQVSEAKKETKEKVKENKKESKKGGKKV